MTAKVKCKVSDNAWQKSKMKYYFGEKPAPMYLLLKNYCLMTARKHETVIQMDPPVVTDFVK